MKINIRVRQILGRVSPSNIWWAKTAKSPKKGKNVKMNRRITQPKGKAGGKNVSFVICGTIGNGEANCTGDDDV